MPVIRSFDIWIPFGTSCCLKNSTLETQTTFLRRVSRTDRLPQATPPVTVTVNVTDVDAVEKTAAAPKAAPEPRSRSKPSWRKATKAEERKGREDEDRMLEPSSPVPSSSPEKIEMFETSERPSEKPADTSAPVEAPEPEPSRTSEETKEEVLPEADVTKVSLAKWAYWKKGPWLIV